ncbi:MAG: transporter substrate-binding domain-containing protein [Halioglobus sp.]
MNQLTKFLYVLVVLYAVVAIVVFTEDGPQRVAETESVEIADVAALSEEEAPDISEETALSETYDVFRPRFGDLDVMQAGRTIRVLTVYSVGRYYLDNAEEKGLVRESTKHFENFINKRFKRKHVRIHVVIIPVARNQLIPALLEGRGDIIHASLSITAERQELVDFSIPSTKPLSEVLITGPSASKLVSIDDLAGQTLFLRHSSSYRESVEELNERFRQKGKPPIIIQTVSELLEDDDLAEMVNAGLLPWAIIDDYKMQWWADAFPKLVVRNDIVFRSGAQMAWAFRKDSPLLKKTVNEFLKKNREGTLAGNVLKNRYIRDFDWASNALAQDDYLRFAKLKSIFQKYGERYGIEYLMIAAQGYQESRLDQSARSRSGAVGVMQIKPSTAGDSNVAIRDIHKVDANIHAGVKYLEFLRRHYFDDPEIDELNQILLALGAYNIGPTRMIKLRNSAAKRGYDRNVWFDNVELAAAREIGREPVQYVANIYKYYLAYKMSAALMLKRQAARDEIGIN